MNARTVAKRLVLAFGALKGDLDGVHDLIGRVKAAEALELKLRVVIGKVHNERQYWYALWFSQGREFESSLNAMIEEINTLRLKAGITGEKWAEIARDQYHRRHVDPPSHPVPGIQTDEKTIESPPIRPPEAPQPGDPVP